MSQCIVTTQEQLDKALADKVDPIYIESPAGVWLYLGATDSARVTATDSARVTAYDSAQVTATGSARVTATGSAQVTAYGSARVRAGAYVSVHLHSARVTVDGGHVIDLTALDLTDLDTWVDYTGCGRDGDDLVLYKALDADLRAERGAFAYPGPGGTVAAPDWTETNDCGGGLHLSPSPEQATQYRRDATRWLECRVAREDFRPIPGDTAKGKARVVRVVAEVDAFGRDLAGGAS